MNEAIAQMAQQNGWTYEEKGDPPALGGNLWEQVSNGIARDKVSGDGWEAGTITGGTRSVTKVTQKGRFTMTTTVSSSSAKGSINLGYLAITLPRRLPHMILDATSNGRGMVTRPRARQSLSLEGDFNSHFRLFVPEGYERDALYVFTPDLMALLIDEAGDLDVEIRDNQLIVYRPGGFDLLDPKVWDRFAELRATVGALAWSQTDRYLDERMPAPRLEFEGAADNEVADQGKRLKRKLPREAMIGVWFGAGGMAVALVVVVLVLILL